MRTHRTLLAALLLAAAACGKKDDASPAQGDAATPAASAAPKSSGDDLTDVRDYKLTMAKIDKLYAAQRNLALKAKAMSPAEREALKRDDDASDPNGSLDDMVRKVDGMPPMRDAIRDAGLTSREFVLASMSLMQSGMAAAVLKMRPKDNADSLVREMKANMDNVRFVQEHEAELTKKQQDLQAEMQRLGVDENS